MTFLQRLSLTDRPLFERLCVTLLLVGAGAGALGLLSAREVAAAWPLLLAAVSAFAVVPINAQRAEAVGWTAGPRVLALLGAGVLGLVAHSLTLFALACCATLGWAAAGRTSSVGRQLLGAGLGVGGGLWALAVVPGLLRLGQALLGETRLPLAGAACGLLLGVVLLPLHLKLHADALAQALLETPGEAGTKLRRGWDRCHLALRSAPAPARRELLALLDAPVREAKRLATTLATLDARLEAADRKDAEAQLAALKTDVTGATDALTRQRLASAAGSLSDSLEHLDELERKRERFGAELRLRLAHLERAALALESAQGEPAELRTVATRLLEQRAG